MEDETMTKDKSQVRNEYVRFERKHLAKCSDTLHSTKLGKLKTKRGNQYSHKFTTIAGPVGNRSRHPPPLIFLTSHSILCISSTDKSSSPASTSSGMYGVMSSNSPCFPHQHEKKKLASCSQSSCISSPSLLSREVSATRL